MTAPVFNGAFPHRWTAEILPQRPMILPSRHYVYPGAVEEVEKGALEVLIQPGRAEAGAQPFLATCALGFRDPAAPTGIWSMPDPEWLCAVSGGYAYLIDTASPERFTMLRYRPVLDIYCYSGDLLREDSLNGSAENLYTGGPDLCRVSLKESSASDGLLLFAGHHSILAWGREGEAWESERLSWEGITVTGVEGSTLRGHGWDLRTDRDVPFALDLKTGKRL
jgi:hypothetical protein